MLKTALRGQPGMNRVERRVFQSYGNSVSSRKVAEDPRAENAEAAELRIGSLAPTWQLSWLSMSIVDSLCVPMLPVSLLCCPSACSCLCVCVCLLMRVVKAVVMLKHCFYRSFESCEQHRRLSKVDCSVWTLGTLGCLITCFLGFKCLHPIFE